MLLIKAILIFAFVKVAYLKNAILELPDKGETEMMDFVRDIYKRFEHLKTSLIYAGESDRTVEELSKMISDKQFMIKISSSYRVRTAMDHEFVYIVLDNSSSLNIYKDHYAGYGFTKANHLIIYGKDDADAFALMKTIQKSRSMRIPKVVIINRLGNIHRMQNYLDICSELPRTSFIGSCGNYSVAKLINFYERPIDNFMGCDIFYYNNNNNKTYESYYLQRIGNLLNFSAIYKDSIQVDIDFSWVLITMSDNLDLIYPYSVYSSMVLVPRAYKIPRWQSLRYIFDANVWMGIFATALSVLFVYLLALKLLFANFDFIRAILNIYAILMFQSVQIFEYKSIKMLIVVFLGFSLIITSTFGSLFYSYLFKQFDAKQIKTVQDIADAGFRLHGQEISAQFIFSSDSPADTYIRETLVKLTRADHYKTWLETIRKHRNITILFDSVSLAGISEILDELHIIPVLNSYIAPVLYKGHPLTKKVSSKFAGFFEMGLHAKWNKDYETRAVLDNFDEDATALSMLHFQFAFGCLLLGLLSGAFVFLLEQFRSKQTSLVKLHAI